jgi:hypothetical protein
LVIIVGGVVDSLLGGNISFMPKIQTNNQAGHYFLEYILGENSAGGRHQRPLFRERIDDQPISVGLPMSMFVTNTNESGEGSLRQALRFVSTWGEVIFNLSSPAIIKLDSQLAIDRNVTITGLGSDVLILSGEDKHRVIFVEKDLNVTIKNNYSVGLQVYISIVLKLAIT